MKTTLENEPKVASATTGNYMHFVNDCDVDLDVYVNAGAFGCYTTHLKANGGTGVPYKPYWQSWDYTVYFYLHSSPPPFQSPVVYSGTINLVHEAKRVRVYAKEGEFNVEVTNA